MLCLVAQTCPNRWDPTDCSPPGSSAHGDSTGKSTGVGCISSSRGSSQPRDQTQVSRIAGGFFTVWAMGKALAVCKESSFHVFSQEVYLCALVVAVFLQLCSYSPEENAPISPSLERQDFQQFGLIRSLIRFPNNFSSFPKFLWVKLLSKNSFATFLELISLWKIAN